MIDFSKITKTIGGIDCCYLGQRSSGDQVLHRFAIVNPTCETFAYFNDQGQRIEYVAPGKWAVTLEGHQIVRPPKIVEVTKWIGLFADDNGDYHLTTSGSDAFLHHSVIAKQKHTFRFEVPNE